MSISDVDLAKEIVDRLNDLVANPDVMAALELLINMRVLLRDTSLADHPTIQIGTETDSRQTAPRGRIDLGFLGMLNGIVGVIPDGKRKGCGFISGKLDDGGSLIGFQLTDPQ